MMMGMPIIGMATTEMVTVVENGTSGYVDTDFRRLIPHMHTLLDDSAEARRLGGNARRHAQARFNIHRFVKDWNSAFASVTGGRLQLPTTEHVSTAPACTAPVLPDYAADALNRGKPVAPSQRAGVP
jgi:hypothetical protein